MDEAVDQNTTLCLPQDEGRTIQLRAHHKLAREFGNRHADRALRADAEARSALLFERPDGRGFDRQDIELCQSVALLAGRVLYQRLRQERPCGAGPRRAAARSGPLVRRALHRPQAAGAGRGGVGPVRRAGARPYRVGASATVQGVVQRVVAAPFEGYIAEATRRAGDEVRQGDVLAVLDTRESWSCCAPATWRCSTAARARMARGDSAAAAIAQAQARQAMAQIQFHRQQIQRSSLRARRSTACWSAAT